MWLCVFACACVINFETLFECVKKHCWCRMHIWNNSVCTRVCACLVYVACACTDPINGVLRNALLAGSMCQWLIPWSLKGPQPSQAPSSFPWPPVTPSSPPPQMGPFISPQNTNNGHWRIPKGLVYPLYTSTRAEWCNDASGGQGEKKGGSYKQTNNGKCKQRFLPWMLKCFLLNSWSAFKFTVKVNMDEFWDQIYVTKPLIKLWTGVEQLTVHLSVLLQKRCSHRIMREMNVL